MTVWYCSTECKRQKELPGKIVNRRGLAFERGISASALIEKQFAPVNFIVPGMIAEGLSLLAGGPKIGKSWFMLGVSVCVAAGMPVFGAIAVEQGDVLYLALEDNERRLKSRLLTMGVQPPKRLTLVTDWPDTESGCLEEVEAWIEGVERPALIVLDVLAKVKPPIASNAPQYEVDYHVMGGLQRLAGKHGVAIVAIHHTRKQEAAEDPFDAVSGTRGITGAADGVLILKRDIGTGRPGAVTIYGRGRDIEEFETALQFNRDNGTYRLLGAAHEVAKTSERQAILDTLRAAAKPLTAREVSDLCGKQYQAVRKTLTRMSHDGEVEKTGRGLYTCPNGPNVPDHVSPSLSTSIGTLGTAIYSIEEEDSAAEAIFGDGA